MRANRSLMGRLVGSFLTVSLLTVLFVAVVAFFEAKAALGKAMVDRLMAMAVETESQLNRWVEVQRDLVLFISRLPQVEKDAHGVMADADPHARERLESLFRSALVRGDIQELFLLRPVGGQVVASTQAQRLGSYHVDELFYARAKSETFVQNVYTSPSTGRPELTIATPLRRSSGELLAVLAAHLNLARIDRLIADRTGLGATGQAYLVSPFHDFVSSERFGREAFHRGVFSEGIDAAIAGRHGVGSYTNYAGVPVLGAFRWNGERELALVVEMDQREAFAPARRLVWPILGIGVASALALAFGVLAVARQIARPILAITRAATAVAGGDFDAQAPVLTTDEVGVLARAFNDMTARLRRLYGDLSEQVAAVEKSQHLLQAIIDNTTLLIGVTDREERFLLLNRGLEQVSGMPQADALGKPAGEVLRAGWQDAYLATARTALREARVVEREMEHERGGEKRAYVLACFPLRAPGAEPYGVGAVATDVTEIKRAQREQQLLEAQVQHAQKLESLGLMAGGIAHDFNNILAGILGNTELALRRLDPESRARTYLDKVIAATRQASDLTGQMMAYAGKSSFHQERFDLNQTVREMAGLVEASIPKKISFSAELAEQPVWIHGNRAQISQLVMNLIVNAAEAVGERAGSVSVSTGRSSASPGFVRLTVSDTGTGMDETTQARMFEPFFSTKGAGRGLGLSAVVGIVRSAGGTLNVRSRLGAGSTVEVSLPSARGAEGPSPEPPLDESAMTGGGRVLLVDDEPAVREVARELLESGGLTVIEAVDGLDGVSVYRTRGAEIDVVLLDMTMPGMNGAEVLDAIRGLDPGARIILTSGYDVEDSVANLDRRDGLEFLQKPFRAQTLLQKVRRVLDSPAGSPASARVGDDKDPLRAV